MHIYNFVIILFFFQLIFFVISIRFFFSCYQPTRGILDENNVVQAFNYIISKSIIVMVGTGGVEKMMEGEWR
jgi:hypothetical protein